MLAAVTDWRHARHAITSSAVDNRNRKHCKDRGKDGRAHLRAPLRITVETQIDVLPIHASNLSVALNVAAQTLQLPSVSDLEAAQGKCPIARALRPWQRSQINN
jgi:hypothetical protein